jgi:hypothetical protein
LKENFRRRRKHTRMIRLKNRRNLIEQTRETEDTSIRATEEKHENGSNEARTADSMIEGVATANTRDRLRDNSRPRQSITYERNWGQRVKDRDIVRHQRKMAKCYEATRTITYKVTARVRESERPRGRGKRRVTSPLARRVTSVL